MPNIKSAKKRVDVSERNRLRNVAVKSAIKTAVRKVVDALLTKEEKTVQEALNKVYSLFDKAVGKGVLHKNTAARKKARLTLRINKELAAK